MSRASDGDDSSRVAARFEVRRVAYVDSEGKGVAPLPEFARDARNLTSIYRAMVLTRAFDAKAIALQRTGRLGTYPSSLGQEAVAVGVAAAMRGDDVLLPSFREHGAQLWRGVTPATTTRTPSPWGSRPLGDLVFRHQGTF